MTTCRGIHGEYDRVDGLPVYIDRELRRGIRVEDLIDWLERRDASCAGYLLDSLRSYLREKSTREERADDRDL